MTKEETAELKANIAFGFDLFVKGAIGVLTILVGVIAWQGQRVLTKIDDHETRLTTIEANRYTTSDALADSRRIGDSMERMNDRLITELKEIRASNPPEWMIKAIDEIKEDVKAIRQQVK